MNYFQKIVIENFQSHQHTAIDFSQGLNVFVGPSDSGKSAILRALRWLLFNTPRGVDFIRSGTKECRVTLTFKDGTEIVRSRSVSINRYILRTAEGEEHIFEGFGNEIPLEITNVHRIQALKLDGKEMVVHLGAQLESPFLLFETAGNKAKVIGRVSGAHSIDKAFKGTSNDRHTVNLEMKRLEQDIQELNEKLVPYSNLLETEQQLCIAEKSFENAKERKKRVERLHEMKESLRSIRVEKEIYQRWFKQKENILLMDSLLKELERKMFLLRQITRLYRRWELIRKEAAGSRQVVERGQILSLVEEKVQLLMHKYRQLHKLERTRERWAGVIDEKARLLEARGLAEKIPCIESILKGLEEKVRKVKVLLTFHHNWKDVKLRIKRGKDFRSDREKEIAALLQRWVQVLEDLKKCPTCGSALHSSVVKRIMQEYLEGGSYVAAGREYSDN